MKTKVKVLIGVSISAFVLILAISLGFLIYGAIYSAKVNIMVAPSTAVVRIGDGEYPVSGEFAMQPGEYAVEVSAEGFATKTGKLVLKDGETVGLNLYLESNNESTKNWYEENAGDALIVGEIQNAEEMKKVNVLLEKEPVLKQLPVTVEYYSDDYSEYTKYTISYVFDDSERGFYLVMKDYTGAKVGALIRTLGEMGMDTVGLEVKYEDLSSEGLGARAEE
ncbi:carboxypeptidase regulatory-like domain-containing protein [Candidatus Saccharibacteria bacterium]|nr:carboxypeptidase regulatory-like domain-containing protein [Candidatus Saccharibacteria bacterium]